MNINLTTLEYFLKKTANAEKLSEQLKALNVEIGEILAKSLAGDKLSRSDLYRLITVEEDALPRCRIGFDIGKPASDIPQEPGWEEAGWRRWSSVIVV